MTKNEGNPRTHFRDDFNGANEQKIENLESKQSKSWRMGKRGRRGRRLKWKKNIATIFIYKSNCGKTYFSQVHL